MDTTITGTMPEIERLEPVHTRGLQRTMGALRMLLGFTFLWAFLDKAFALGFSTGRVVSDAGETVKIALDFSHDFKGDQTYMFHCHNLEHEDQGMMMSYRVVG